MNTKNANVKAKIVAFRELHAYERWLYIALEAIV